MTRDRRLKGAFTFDIIPGNGPNRWVVRVEGYIVGKLSGTGNTWKIFGPDNREIHIPAAPLPSSPGELSFQIWEERHRFWVATKLTEILYESGWLFRKGLASENGYYGRYKPEVGS